MPQSKETGAGSGLPESRPIGCGKTALVEFMAAVTGHTKATEILKVQLGDQTDSKVRGTRKPCWTTPQHLLCSFTVTLTVFNGTKWTIMGNILYSPCVSAVFNLR